LDGPAALLRSRVDGRFLRNLLRLGFLPVDFSSSVATGGCWRFELVLVLIKDKPAIRVSRLDSDGLRVEVLIEPVKEDPGDGLA
jgi:hypothetical protein